MPHQATAPPELTFLVSPKLMRPPKGDGAIVTVDLAFANGSKYITVTRPFIEAVGERLVAWVDHHPHPGWAEFGDDPRFVLVDRRAAPACPQLIDPALVAHSGSVQHLLAHGDFDGCVAAAKFLRGGIAPYPDADEDARAVDTPGRGFVCSARGERLAMAMDQQRTRTKIPEYLRFVTRVCEGLVAGTEPPALRNEIDRLASSQHERLARLEPLLDDATRPHPEIILLRPRHGLSIPDRKVVLRWLEQRAKVAVLDVGDSVSLATFDEERLDLSRVGGVEGTRGLAWGKVSVEAVVRDVAALLRE